MSYVTAPTMTHEEEAKLEDLFDALLAQLSTRTVKSEDCSRAGEYLVKAARCKKHVLRYPMVLAWYGYAHHHTSITQEHKVLQLLSLVLNDEQYEMTLVCLRKNKAWNALVAECESTRPEDKLAELRADFVPPTQDELKQARAVVVKPACPGVPYRQLADHISMWMVLPAELEQAGAYLAAAAKEGRLGEMLEWYELSRVRRTLEQEAEDWASLAAVASPAQGDMALEKVSAWTVRPDRGSRRMVWVALHVARERRASAAVPNGGN